MSSNKIAISMPGKMGDALYALPIAREASKRHGMKCDFYTSEYCRPMKRLVEYQSYVDEVVIPSNYKIENMGCGIQPWYMPVDTSLYERVYQLGFRRTPDKPLHEFIASSIGLGGELEIKYDYPNLDIPEEEYIVMAPRGETTYKELFLDVIRKSPVKVVQIGGPGEAIGGDVGVTGLDMLETLAWIAKSKAFVGLMSSQLVLANGFPIPKIAPHDGKSWDMRHVVRSPYNYYPVNPTAEEILALALAGGGYKLIYSKSLNPEDYTLMTEHEHVRNVMAILNGAGVPFRFEHPHRAWEYGIVLNALRGKNVKTVLDVGGGGSIFAPAAAKLGMHVTQVDPGNVGWWIMRQAMALNLDDLSYVQNTFQNFSSNDKFDAVTCISVLEHVIDDVEFFEKLLEYGNIVALTFDFSRDGLKKCDGHIRTYNTAAITQLGKIAHRYGFAPIGGTTDYSHDGEYVNGYNFASLILERVADGD